MIDNNLQNKQIERLINWFFVFLGLHLWHPGGSQATGQIEAVATLPCHSHNNARSEPCLQPTPQLTAKPDP